MTPRLSGPFCLFVWFSLCSSLFWELGDKVQWSLEKFAILTLKSRSHVRILIHDRVLLGTAAPEFLGTRWLIPWCSSQLASARVNLKQLEEETELGDNESFNDLYKENHEIRSV